MSEQDDATPTEITFRFIKSPLYRVIHVDGAWGGLTGRGNIHLAVYSEQSDPPPSLSYRVDEKTGALIDLPKQEPDPLVRQIESHMIMNRNTAVSIRDWLTNRIELLDKAIAERIAADQNIPKETEKQ